MEVCVMLGVMQFASDCVNLPSKKARPEDGRCGVRGLRKEGKV